MLLSCSERCMGMLGVSLEIGSGRWEFSFFRIIGVEVLYIGQEIRCRGLIVEDLKEICVGFDFSFSIGYLFVILGKMGKL